MADSGILFGRANRVILAKISGILRPSSAEYSGQAQRNAQAKLSGMFKLICLSSKVGITSFDNGRSPKPLCRLTYFLNCVSNMLHKDSI